MDNENMAMQIAKQRKQLNLTQKQLAEQLGVTDKAVSKWERGAGRPDISLLPALSQALGLPVETLLGKSPTNNKKQSENKTAGETKLSVTGIFAKMRALVTRRRIRNMVTFAALLGICVCAICNVAIQGGLTWALYPIASLLYAWVVFIPLLQFPSGGPPLSLGLMSVLTIPFLLLLGAWSGTLPAMLFISVRVSILGLLYLWGLYFLFKKVRLNLYVKIGISVLVAIPLTWAVNFTVDVFTGYGALDIWDWIVYAFLALVSLAFFLVGSGKGRSRRSPKE